MPRNFTLLLKLFGLVVDGLERCRTCQIGEYQSEYAQVTCSACPGGKSTISRGATSLSQCKGKTNYGFILEQPPRSYNPPPKDEVQRCHKPRKNENKRKLQNKLKSHPFSNMRDNYTFLYHKPLKPFYKKTFKVKKVFFNLLRLKIVFLIKGQMRETSEINLQNSLVPALLNL